MKNIKIISTEDGSDTIYWENLDETYHSTHGAFGESQHVFIKNGLKPAVKIFFPESQHFDALDQKDSEKNKEENTPKNRKRLVVLEVGLGTGLNALLTSEYCHKKNIPLLYVGLEPHPLPKNITEKLNHKKWVHPDIQKHWEPIHNGPWEKCFEVAKNFCLLKTKTPLQDFTWEDFADKKEENKINLVYFDGFAPSKAHDVWCLDNFIKISHWMKCGGILTSYSASNSFRKNLTKSRWQWKSLEGALKKREMTFAQWTF